MPSRNILLLAGHVFYYYYFYLRSSFISGQKIYIFVLPSVFFPATNLATIIYKSAEGPIPQLLPQILASFCFFSPCLIYVGFIFRVTVPHK